jgi:hypothetical protein
MSWGGIGVMTVSWHVIALADSDVISAEHAQSENWRLAGCAGDGRGNACFGCVIFASSPGDVAIACRRLLAVASGDVPARVRPIKYSWPTVRFWLARLVRVIVQMNLT